MEPPFKFCFRGLDVNFWTNKCLPDAVSSIGKRELCLGTLGRQIVDCFPREVVYYNRKDPVGSRM